MLTRVLIIGGYGNFGQYITRALAKESNLQLVIAGRNRPKAEALASSIEAVNRPESVQLDIHSNLSEVLSTSAVDIVIHTCGPYQSQRYFVSEACIKHRCHYIDLADARRFVANINTLDQRAKQADVLVLSGASSVPTLTSAIIDHYLSQFDHLQEVEYAISSAQRTNQGLATTQAILSYVGKPFKTLINGAMANVYGWQSLKLRKFWGLNRRYISACDVPDLELFPQRYPDLKTIRFRAGIESKFQHLGLYLLSWLVRAKLLRSLQPVGKLLLTISRWFDPIGTNDSGFYMDLIGVENKQPKYITFEVLARDGDGLYIPCIPAILITRKLASGEFNQRGALPCIGHISLDEYLKAFQSLNIRQKPE